MLEAVEFLVEAVYLELEFGLLVQLLGDVLVQDGEHVGGVGRVGRGG